MKKYLKYLSPAVLAFLIPGLALAAFSTVPLIRNSSILGEYLYYPGDNLGLGMVTPTRAKLEIQATTTTSGSHGLTIWDSAGNDMFDVLGNGFVGIGTSSPFANLSIATPNGANYAGGTALFAIASSTQQGATTTVLSFNTAFSSVAGSAGILPYLAINNPLSPNQLPSPIAIATVGGIYSLGASTPSGVVLGLNPAASGTVSAIENTGTGGYTPRDLVIRNNATESVRFKTGVPGSMTFGGITTAFPSLVRSGTALTIGLADGSLGGSFGVGTSTPFGKVAINLNNGETNTLSFNIASSTASATTTIFGITNTGHVFASSTAPTVSSGSIDGTDTGGRVLSCSSTCTITFATPYVKVPSCMVQAEAGSITNTLSYTPTVTSLAVTETGLGTFDWVCKGQ